VRVLVTGAAGFIGANLSQKLKSLGHDIFMVDRYSDYYSTDFKINRVSSLNLLEDIYKLDLNIPNILDKFLNQQIETVIHLAAQPGIRVSYPEKLNYLNDNLNSFNNVLCWALNNGVKKFLYASSSSVYENAQIKPFTESEILRAPSNIYPLTKWVNEYLANSLAQDGDMEISGLRFFSVYGPYGRPDMAIHRLIESAFTGKTFELNGDGKIKRDFTFVDDVSTRILSLIDREGSLERIYNIGGGSSITMDSLIKVVEETVGNRISIVYKPAHSADLQSTLANNSRINEIHGDNRWTSINEGVALTSDWYKNSN
jgi:UDP-glucuronate 4-epimerase